MSAPRHNAGVIQALVLRDMKIFVKQPSQLFGALATPLLFWLVLGFGLAPSFKGSSSYQTYFFPGIIVMLVLFTSISTTMSVIEDRHQGFMQGVLASPGSRWAVSMGKVFGGGAVGFFQAILLLLLAPLAGYSYGAIDWPLTLVALALGTICFTASGFSLAWKLDSSAGYHAVMFIVLLPLWFLSGAVFPMQSGPMLWIQRFNPMTYAVEALRRSIEGAPLSHLLLPFAVLAGVTVLLMALAATVARRGGT